MDKSRLEGEARRRDAPLEDPLDRIFIPRLEAAVRD